MPTLNWTQIAKEIQQYTDIEKLKKDLDRIKADIRKGNLKAYISPAAAQKLEDLESKYSDILKSVHRTQRQLDREVHRFVRQFRNTRKVTEKKFDHLFDLAMAQKSWLEKASSQLKAKVLKTKPKKRKKRTTNPRKRKTSSTHA